MPGAQNPSASPRAQHFRYLQQSRRQRVRHTSFGIASPTEISGLVGWWDFSDISSLWQDEAMTSAVTTNGQIILGVTDKSGTGNHLTTTTNGPTYTTGGQAGRSIAAFDGVNDQLAVTYADASWTLFIAAKKTSAVDATVRHLVQLGGADVSLRADTAGDAADTFFYATQAATVQVITGATATTAHAYMARVNSTSSLDLAYDNNTVINVDPYLDQVSAGAFILGMAHATQFGDWKVFEAALFSSAVATADATSMFNYLAARWAL